MAVLFPARPLLIVLILLFFTRFVPVEAQDCNLRVKGKVFDAQTGEGLPSASVYIKDLGKGTITNADGAFSIGHICGCCFDLTVGMIGYRTVERTVDLRQSDEVIIRLELLQEELIDIIVEGQSLSASKRESQHLNTNAISESANKSLATMMGSLSGVNVLKTGSGVAKPVVQGVFGNRLPIIVNGVAQAGQQWGNDHSPEVDPQAAHSISVLSGVDALQYQGMSLGNAVLVEPEHIQRQSHLSGRAGYFLESNGWGNGINLQLQKYNEGLGWKINGTLKKSGDHKAADYYLSNTGVQEGNMAIQLEKSINEHWLLKGHMSTFNTEIGILRGAHIGNLSDLDEALSREEPFYTNDYFSYRIDAPRQTVSHNTIKLEGSHFLSNERVLKLAYALQINNRKEYDVRRGGRSDTPALSLLQYAHFFEARYAGYAFGSWRVNSGLQLNMTDNTNNPETGILPLIPDYFAIEPGIFLTLNRIINNWQLNFGGRYDYQSRHVLAISNTVPREIIHYDNHFHNFKVASDFKYHFSSATNIGGGISVASRQPEVNELYSNGLHQGVGGIELGDPDLGEESAIKGVLNFNTNMGTAVQFESSLYYQYINGYIFLAPQDEERLTIRGAFPVFRYEQANASIHGLDLTGHYHLSEHIQVSAMYSYLRGSNLSDDEPLINMPSSNFRSTLSYGLEHIGQLEDVSFEINQQYVFKQGHLRPEQDYMEAPDGYNLIGLKVSGVAPLGPSGLNAYLKVDNLFNVSYRDYMNRMRYYADDLGINFVLGLTWNF